MGVLAGTDGVGIDICAEAPKALTAEAVQASDVVITMGCGDTCPVFPGKRYLDWQLPDPASPGVDAVRPIRDEIEHRIRGLIDEIAPEPRHDRTPGHPHHIDAPRARRCRPEDLP